VSNCSARKVNFETEVSDLPSDCLFIRKIFTDALYLSAHCSYLAFVHLVLNANLAEPRLHMRVEFSFLEALPFLGCRLFCQLPPAQIAA